MNLKEMLAHDFLTMNRVPDFMPISTLVCPPSQTFTKQYLNQTAADISPTQGFNSTISHIPIGYQNLQSARTPTNYALNQNQRQLDISGKETHRGQIGMMDMNQALLGTTRDLVGISNYHTQQ